MQKLKFAVGDKVYFLNDPQKEVGEIIGFSFNKDTGFSYQINHTYYDFGIKKEITGVRTALESELVQVIEKGHDISN